MFFTSFCILSAPGSHCYVEQKWCSWAPGLVLVLEAKLSAFIADCDVSGGLLMCDLVDVEVHSSHT